MSDYRQITKYEIANPYGTDILEGDWIHFLTKDNEEVCGVLVEANSGSFVIRNPDEEEKE